MNRAFGIINFAGNHVKVDGLQDFRPVGAFSFLGRYRIIDFRFLIWATAELTISKMTIEENLAPYRAPRNRPPLQHQLKTRQSEYHVYRTRSDRRHLQYRHYRLYGKHRVPRGDASWRYVVIAPASYMVHKADYSRISRRSYRIRRGHLWCITRSITPRHAFEL